MKTVLKRMSARRGMLYAPLAGGHLGFGFALQAANQLLSGVRSGTYNVTVESTGFVKYTLRQVHVDPGREAVLPAIKLDVASTSQSVDVSAAAQTVQTSNAEISITVTNEQIRRLPLLDRDPFTLILTQAGVSSNGRSDTVINGQRASHANVTMDGINIDNAVDYTPNLLLLDQVSEFTVSTSNTNASVGGGLAQIAFTTPSGHQSISRRGLLVQQQQCRLCQRLVQ